ncbi:kinase-like protein [Neolentinus lepideus HHB14362 ss-1]|uniref:Kinase-like protein n=1 Tax=Neolentinus lepideus HHB14362 ss-1 TaxID=1314782 RepID=A0A165TQY8_9AGAM|nr:kinase-like protein [Neolentinus lepideus HHB14362 ss-1]
MTWAPNSTARGGAFRWSRRLYPSNHPRVFRLSRHTVMKVGRCVRSTEAATMRFVSARTTIRVPKAYKYWTLPNGEGVLIMEWLHGTYTLHERWKLLSKDDKLRITRQIRSAIEELRALPQPDALRGMICPVDGAALWDERVRVQRCGPFESEHAFNEYRLSLLDHFLWEPGARRDVENIRIQLKDDHRILFTHGDIGKRNVLIDHDNNLAAIIDWEMAGWMPEYWEYVKTVHGMWEDEEWLILSREMVPPYDSEMKADDQYIIVNGGAPF